MYVNGHFEYLTPLYINFYVIKMLLTVSSIEYTVAGKLFKFLVFIWKHGVVCWVPTGNISVKATKYGCGTIS